MHKVNAGFTMVVPLKRDHDRIAAATDLLVKLDADQTRLPFGESPTTHFATITIIPAQTYRDEPLPAVLLFATSYCGPTRAHLTELVGVMGDGLREVFSHCADFETKWSNEELVQWLLEHRHGDTFYSGMQHLSPEDVRRHRQLREAIQAYLDERVARGERLPTASTLRREIQDYVKSRPDLAWAQEPHKPTLRAWFALYWRSLLVEAVPLVLLLCTLGWLLFDSSVLGWIAACGGIAVGVFLLFMFVCVVTISDAEAGQTYLSRRPSDERARALAATQARPVINEFTLGGPIKEEGNLRPIFLRIIMWFVARVADGLPGIPKLATGINIPTVATARWIVSDRGRRVLFISNYTNEGEAYVRDFIETPAGAMRINLSFGFGRGFPKTQWIILGGALDDPNTYLHSLAENQLPTLFWYGPYRDISIDNIKVNRKIREGLFASDGKQDPQEWLHLL